MPEESGTNPDIKWLKPKKQKAICELARNPKASKEIAARLKVSEKTLRNWGSEQLFRDALRTERQIVLEEFRQQIESVAPRALQELARILEDPNARDADKVSAARLILDRALGNQESAQIQINATNAQIVRLTPAQAAELGAQKERIRKELEAKNGNSTGSDYSSKAENGSGPCKR